MRLVGAIPAQMNRFARIRIVDSGWHSQYQLANMLEFSSVATTGARHARLVRASLCRAIRVVV